MALRLFQIFAFLMFLECRVQQNHDGLPQKAGYPQADLNEIHGAWFDPSNPVVKMTGFLREDLVQWLEREQELADLVLCLGTLRRKSINWKRRKGTN
jgi:hypothetical protein